MMNKRILERAAIIKLHEDGLKNGEILKTLKIGRNSRDKVRRTIERYTETGSLENDHAECTQLLIRSYYMSPMTSNRNISKNITEYLPIFE